jgi:hypothetical protein
MMVDLRGINLLGLRLSERNKISSQMNSATDIDLLAQAIENILSGFIAADPECEEQIYLFGAEMRKLLESSKIPQDRLQFRTHPSKEVEMIFAGGFLGWTFGDTLAALEGYRKQERAKIRMAHRNRQTEQKNQPETLLKRIEQDLTEIALVPGDKVR